MPGQQDTLNAAEFGAATDFVLESGDAVVLRSLTILSMVTIASVGRGQNFGFRFRKCESYGKKSTTIDLSIIHSPIYLPSES